MALFDLLYIIDTSSMTLGAPKGENRCEACDGERLINFPQWWLFGGLSCTVG